MIYISYIKAWFLQLIQILEQIYTIKLHCKGTLYSYTVQVQVQVHCTLKDTLYRYRYRYRYRYTVQVHCTGTVYRNSGTGTLYHYTVYVGTGSPYRNRFTVLKNTQYRYTVQVQVHCTGTGTMYRYTVHVQYTPYRYTEQVHKN